MIVLDMIPPLSDPVGVLGVRTVPTSPRLIAQPGIVQHRPFQSRP